MISECIIDKSCGGSDSTRERRHAATRAYQVALYTAFYNFCRIHTTLRMPAAMAAGVTDTLRDVRWIVGLVEARTLPPGPRGPYRNRGQLPRATAGGGDAACYDGS